MEAQTHPNSPQYAVILLMMGEDNPVSVLVDTVDEARLAITSLSGIHPELVSLDMGTPESIILVNTAFLRRAWIEPITPNVKVKSEWLKD